MRALVTGGAGFIGSNITASLIERGFDVIVLDSLESGYERNVPTSPKVRFVLGDVRDRAAVDSCMEGADYVFHLAASVGNKKSIDKPVFDAEVNVIGTINVLEAARAAQAKKVVFSSSAGTFGELKTLPIRLDHPTDPDSPYGCTKLCAEKMCRAYTHLYGLKTVALRYFNVYGRNQRFDAYGNVIPIFVHQILRGETLTIFGDGEQTRDFVNVTDVVQANLESAFAPEVTGAFNIGSGTRITINDLVRMLGDASGLTPKIRYGDPRPGDVRDSLADISDAEREFGFKPSVEIEAGLREYWAWAKQDASVSV